MVRSGALNGARARSGRRADERGESLAFVIVWPVLSTFILLLIMHAFIASVARAEADLAVSEGLRAAWRSTSAVHPSTTGTNGEPLGIQMMADAARNAAARVAGGGEGWRWWTPSGPEQCGSGVECETVRVYSNWCTIDASNNLVPLADGERGWIRIEVVGNVIGPLASVWPGRLDRLATAAEGPAVLRAPGTSSDDPWILPTPDPARDLCE